MRTITRLKCGSAIALAMTATLVSGAAWGQAAAPATEEVTVTGTSIRGVQPIGSNLI